MSGLGQFGSELKYLSKTLACTFPKLYLDHHGKAAIVEIISTKNFMSCCLWHYSRTYCILWTGLMDRAGNNFSTTIQKLPSSCNAGDTIISLVLLLLKGCTKSS